MTSVKKVHTFEIIDKFNTSEETLLKYARESAENRADAYGWQLLSVEKSDKTPVHEGKETRHFFDMCGVEIESSGVGSDQEKSAASEAPYRRAAKESTL